MRFLLAFPSFVFPGNASVALQIGRPYGRYRLRSVVRFIDRRLVVGVVVVYVVRHASIIPAAASLYRNPARG